MSAVTTPAKPATAAPRTKCARGHDVTDPANQIVWKSAGNAVRCRACYDLKRAEQKARRDAAAAKAKKPAATRRAKAA